MGETLGPTDLEVDSTVGVAPPDNRQRMPVDTQYKVTTTPSAAGRAPFHPSHHVQAVPNR